MTTKDKIVSKGKTKNELDFIIRYPKMSDLNDLTKYINTLSKEKTFIPYQGERVSLKEEKEWLNKTLTRIKKRQEVGLSPIINNRIVGVCGIRLGTKIQSHIGILGISIAKDYRGEGLGQKLMEETIREARKNLKGLRIIVLDVFETNPNAISLYKKLGFKEYGQLPEGLFYKNKYIGEISMFKKV